MKSPFAPLLDGSESQWILSENSHFIAAIERKPLAIGHMVLISKRLEDDVFDLSDTELKSGMELAKKVASAMKQVLDCEKVGMAVLGLQARHAHIHLVPLKSAEDLNFTRAKLEVDEKLILQTLNKIKQALK